MSDVEAAFLPGRAVLILRPSPGGVTPSTALLGDRLVVLVLLLTPGLFRDPPVPGPSALTTVQPTDTLCHPSRQGSESPISPAPVGYLRWSTAT